MNENVKKGLLLGVALLLILIAGWRMASSYSDSQPHAEGPIVKMPAGFKSEKEKAIEAQSKAQAAPSVSDPTKSEADRDATLAGG